MFCHQLETLFSCQDYQIQIFCCKYLLLNIHSLIPSWWISFWRKSRLFRNPHKKAVFLVHTTYVYDLGFRFDKLQTDFEVFCSKIIDQSDTAGTGSIQATVIICISIFIFLYFFTVHCFLWTSITFTYEGPLK